jgi:excisionase family DNA binding protein
MDWGAIAMNEVLPMLLTPRQAAELLGSTESQVRSLIRLRRIAHVAIGSRPMIPRDAVKAFVSENTVKPCRDEIQVRAFDSASAGVASTSAGQSTAATASAARARQIAERLKTRSPSSSEAEGKPDGRVIPLRSS